MSNELCELIMALSNVWFQSYVHGIRLCCTIFLSIIVAMKSVNILLRSLSVETKKLNCFSKICKCCLKGFKFNIYFVWFGYKMSSFLKENYFFQVNGLSYIFVILIIALSSGTITGFTSLQDYSVDVQNAT